MYDGPILEYYARRYVNRRSSIPRARPSRPRAPRRGAAGATTVVVAVGTHTDGRAPGAEADVSV
jgi:hypothetical protein